MDPVRVGVVGLGNISAAYFKAAPNFPILQIVAAADVNPDAVAQSSQEFGVPGVPLDGIFTDPGIDVILNLTNPTSHVDVGLRALAGGKHVYSEKPLGVSFADARQLIEVARTKKLRVGCAPDTFFGGAHQVARQLIDQGKIGKAIGGTAFMMVPGHESWHPNPAFYYAAGGGPMLDMGPYYLTYLINLLGPVARVAGMVATPRSQRPITSKERFGELIPVLVPTHVTGLLSFSGGAIVLIVMSFDVAGHRHSHIELYGTGGSIVVPDPNRFGGEVELLSPSGEWIQVAETLPYADGNYRSIGLADMAFAIRTGRPHRASGDLALHVLEVMEAVGRASENRSTVDITTTVERPAPLAQSLRYGELSD